MHIRVKDHINPGLEFSLDISEDLTVGDLKSRIESEFPSNPSSSSQKLIFSGRLLSDEEALADVTRRYNSSSAHTFHLLVTSSTTLLDTTPDEEGPLRNRATGNRGINDEGRRNAAQFGMAGVAEQAVRRHATGRGFFETQNYQLLLKLILVLYLFGRGASTVRLGFMIVGAFVIYMYQIGLFGSQDRGHRFPVRERPPPAAMVRPAAPVPHAHPPAEAVAPPLDANRNDPGPEFEMPVVPEVSAANHLLHASDQASPSDRSFGVLENVVGPFFYSLMPSWTPETGFA